MHQPRPYGYFGPELDAAGWKEVDGLVRRLTNIKETSGLGSLRMTRALAGGGYVTVLDMGGVLKAFVHQPEPAETHHADFDGFAGGAVPMLFSGVITKDRVRKGEGVRLTISKATRKRLEALTQEAVAEQQELFRFNVPCSDALAEFVPPDPGVAEHTQYVQWRSSRYSGLMASLTQIVAGYGRWGFSERPDDAIEHGQMPVPPRVAAKIERELRGIRLPGYTGIPHKDGSVQYDYKFSRTEFVTRDTGGGLWLVRVSQEGVFTMPLPLVPATQTKAFDAWVREELADNELEWVLDRFGGMPSGETFPSDKDEFDAWRRAGAIIKVCDSGTFYDYLAYAPALGWSTNMSGTQAYNTCYDYSTSTGLIEGRMFILWLTLGPNTFDGRTVWDLEPLGAGIRTRFTEYIVGLLERARGERAEQNALKYKLSRVPVETILEKAHIVVDMDEEYSYWRDLELDPIAVHTGAVVQTREGTLYHPAKRLGQPQIKFAQTELLGTCLSFDFTPAFPIDGPHPKCDTPMVARFVGDDLKVVHYFYDSTAFLAEDTDNFDNCMQLGSWFQNKTTGFSAIQGHFYMTDADERRPGAPEETNTQIVGRDIGFQLQPTVNQDVTGVTRTGDLLRFRYYYHVTNQVRVSEPRISMAVCVPWYDPASVFYGTEESDNGRFESETLRVYRQQDPNSYRWYTHHQAFAYSWIGGPTGGNVSSFPPDQLVPQPDGWGNPVWVTGYNYYPTECSDFADYGNWMGSLPQDVTYLFETGYGSFTPAGGALPTPPEYSEQTSWSPKYETAYFVVRFEGLTKAGAAPYRFFQPSPDAHGNTFYADAVRNMAGTVRYINISQDNPQLPGTRMRWGWTKFADHKRPHCFIGVINE